MTQVTIHEAKTHLSRLIEKVLQGEEVVIAWRSSDLREDELRSCPVMSPRMSVLRVLLVSTVL